MVREDNEDVIEHLFSFLLQYSTRLPWTNPSILLEDEITDPRVLSKDKELIQRACQRIKSFFFFFQQAA